VPSGIELGFRRSYLVLIILHCRARFILALISLYYSGDSSCPAGWDSVHRGIRVGQPLYVRKCEDPVFGLVGLLETETRWFSVHSKLLAFYGSRC
jgi:hypothetical protein